MKVDELPPKADKFWERPEGRDQGDASMHALHSQVGYVSTTWESLENDLSHLFEVLVETESPAARRAYGSLMSGHGRRTAIRAASEIFLERKKVCGEDKERLYHLLAHIDAASKRRDDIVHGVSTRVVFPDGDRGCFLVPPDYNFAFTFANPKPSPPYWRHLRARYRYTSEDMVTLVANFRLVNDALNEYTAHVKAHKESSI
jgi:hypothetical protein